MNGKFISHKPFTLESGETLSSLSLDYSTVGNFDKGHVVWVFPGIENEWPEMNKLFYRTKYFLVTAKMPTGKNFFTLRDMMRAYQLLKNDLEINRIHAGIGASMGGQLMLEWAVEEPELFEYIFPIATNAAQSAWVIAFNTSQRLCLEMGAPGVNAAKAFASILEGQSPKNGSAGARTYYLLTKSMDSHNLSRGRKSAEQALQKIKSKTLVMSLAGDMLFPKSEQEFLAKHIPGAELKIIPSSYGHAGYILETKTILKNIEEFICKHTNN
jgi:homoserine O-acetyltransferase